MHTTTQRRHFQPDGWFTAKPQFNRNQHFGYDPRRGGATRRRRPLRLLIKIVFQRILFVLSSVPNPRFDTVQTLKKYAVLIAVENYQDSAISKVTFARRDAEEFSKALEMNGFEKSDQVILVDQQATKAVIESRVRKAIRQLQKEDVFFFYYAGHGFSKGARNFISSYDTLDSDWDGTSVSLSPLFGEMQASDSSRIALFLDCCESGIKATPGMRGIYDNLKEHELEAFLNDAKHCVCFAACRSDESSYPSGSLKHGIWTFHLIEAFKGNASIALERGMLTANSLQNYLKVEVPRTIRQTYSGSQNQTPWMYGAMSGDFILADLRPIIEERRSHAGGSGYVRKLSFSVQEQESLTRLSGWKKSHRVPDRYTDSTRSFASSCASKDLEEDLDSVFEGLKKAFAFARRDIVVSQPGDGTGTIITPYFNYSVHVELNADDLDEVIWTRTVDSIKAPEQISTDAFAEVFDDVFDTLEFSLPQWIKIEDFIDAVEAAKNPDVTLDYDRDATYCDIHISGANGKLRLSSNQLSLSFGVPTGTAKLIESFVATRKLIQRQVAPLINFLG